jgi:hypothetical protein
MDVAIVNALIPYWISKGKYGAALRLAGREGRRGVTIDDGCYKGLIDSCIGMRDVGELRDVVIRPVYEGLVNGGDGVDVFANAIHGMIVCMLDPAIDTAVNQNESEVSEHVDGEHDIVEESDEKTSDESISC